MFVVVEIPDLPVKAFLLSTPESLGVLAIGITLALAAILTRSILSRRDGGDT